MPGQAGYAYLVDADHTEEKYRAQDKPIVVHREERTFSASAFPYGRSVGAPSPEAAIQLLLERNGCTNVRIKFRPKTGWD